MSESVTMLSGKESYAPTKWTKFLWWLSTAEEGILKNCVTDRNRYSIIGMSVLATWLFATLAWSYFFSTVVENVFAVIALGIFMGWIILTIDRALIKGINKFNKQKILPLVFRGLLAITIGTFMAQPALLYLFNKEIHVQISLDNEQKKKDKLLQSEVAIASSKNQLTQQRNELQKRLDEKYKEVNIARNSFIAETDGTGGSKKIGLKDIAKAKQNEYEKLNGEYQLLSTQLQPQINLIDSSLNVIQSSIQKEQQQFEILLNDGFLTRIEALNNLTKTNTALQFRYYLIVFILVLIELMPVLSKTFLSSGSYEEKLLLTEKSEKELAQQSIENELQLKKQFNQSAYENDSKNITEFFTNAKKESSDKIKSHVEEWKNSNTTANDLWNEVKENLLLKQQG